jgi:hypothetical protein
MTAHPSPSAAAPAPYVRFGPVHAVPSLHGRRRFADLVRRAFFAVRPRAIAVELPATLEATVRKAVERLPYLSVVAYDDFTREIEPVRRILPVTPEDSLIEAVRLGMAFGVPLHFIDRDVLNHTPEPVRVPDDYLIERIGLERYWRKAAEALPPAAAGSPDAEREVEMAARLRALPEESILFVCGLSHLGAVMGHYAGAAPAPPGGVTQREQKLYTVARESLPNVLSDFPRFAYAYELARRGLRPEDFPQLVPLPSARGGEFEAAQEARRETERGLLARLGAGPATGDAVEEDYALLADLLRGGVRLYQREWNEQPSPARLATVSRYARNLALVGRRLAPSKYHLVLAAQNTVNDDFAFQVLRLADDYPFFEEDSDLPELKVEGEAGEADGERLVLRLRLPRALQEELDAGAVELQERPEELQEGSWRERWELGEHHVSHIPQDLRVEHFFDYIREKCRRLLSDQQVRSQELQASLMDGLDLRETLRNLPLGKIFVKEQLPGVAEVGPVVVIFHPPGEERQFTHEMMWYAEHAEESDLALYSTPPGVVLDGPGMSRCQYGGVLSLFPPTGRARVWGNSRYSGARNRAEMLLKAAIDLSRKPVVAYVAPQGPAPEMLALAASRGIQILYVPLDSLSADTLKRVRTFHILADRTLRPLAPLYLN